MMCRGVKYPEEKMVVAISKPLVWEMKPKEKMLEEKVKETLTLADGVLGMTVAEILIIVKEKKEKKLLPTRPVTPKPVEKQVVQTIVGPQEIPRPLSL